jgi:NADH:ubiquinone oxidoreductase subunit C
MQAKLQNKIENKQITCAISALFSRYYQYFNHHNASELEKCYHVPCCLSTPDKLLYIENSMDLQQEFSSIFKQLKQAQITTFKSTGASYSQLSADQWLACINWQFIDKNDQVFSHFSAFYTLINVRSEQHVDSTLRLKISHVISHELENSLTLAYAFSISTNE